VIAIIVKEPYAYSGVWARLDFSILGAPEIDRQKRIDVVQFLDGTKEIYRRSGDNLPGELTIGFSAPILSRIPQRDRDGGGGDINPLYEWHFGSLLLDAYLNGRTTEFLFYQKGKTRGVAFAGQITGPPGILTIGDHANSIDHREPGGSIDYEQELILEPQAYGVCSNITNAALADYIWLAGDVGIYS